MRADEFLEHYRRGERNFRGVNLRGIYLRDVRLQDVDLNCADLRGASLMSVDFSGANLHRADLSGAFLIHSNLSFANLTQANLTKAFLILANLHQSCLTEANLSHTNLTKANLSEVVGLVEAILDQTILTGALLPPRSPQASHRLLRFKATVLSLTGKLYRMAKPKLSEDRLSNISGTVGETSIGGDSTCLTETYQINRILLD